MFFESDRSKSELLLQCLKNGTYAHVDEWPVCLEGILDLEPLSEVSFSDIACPLPPDIPINDHYQNIKEAQVQ